jgi:hypothetical protein
MICSAPVWPLVTAVLSAVIFCFAPGTAAQNVATPRDLLEAAFPWQPQGGQWKVEGSVANVIAGETMAELTATKGVPLTNRWLTCKVALTGPATRGGVWFSGIRDERGETLRFAVDAASGSLTNGRGRNLGGLGNDLGTVDLVFQFTPEKVTVQHKAATLVELPVQYVEPEATLSLFAERGAAEFRDLVLTGPAAALVSAPIMARPARGDKKGPVVPVRSLAADFTAGSLSVLKSGWNEYFGVHFDTQPGPWRMVRQFDGPRFGRPPRNRHTGDVKTYDGPFAKMPVQVSLADFRDWQRKDSRGLDENLKTLVEQDRSALFIAPWASPFSPAQQDEVWGLMKAVYGANIGAEGRVFFQWGDEINHRRLGAEANPRVLSSEPRNGVNPPRSKTADADVVAYAENYFAPAVEAVRRASEEIFHDPRKIPVLIGSCARPSVPENREWYSRVLEHELSGSLAPSLKGQRVVDLVDYLTVNYPFHEGSDATGLQELWTRYGARVKGLWITEEYGAMARGPGALLQSASTFLAWVAENDLTAEQTRLLWNVPQRAREQRSMPDFLRGLGSSLQVGPLRVAKAPHEGGWIYRISAGDGRLMLVHAPGSERRARPLQGTTEVVITPPVGTLEKAWLARVIENKRPRGAQDELVVPVEKRDGKLVVQAAVDAKEPWAILFETP